MQNTESSKINKSKDISGFILFLFFVVSYVYILFSINYLRAEVRDLRDLRDQIFYEEFDFEEVQTLPQPQLGSSRYRESKVR